MSWYDFLRLVLPRINANRATCTVPTIAVTEAFIDLKEFAAWLRTVDVVADMDADYTTFQKRKREACPPPRVLG